MNLMLRQLEPLTKNQGVFLHNYNNYTCSVLAGVAGTGKTFMALYVALKDVYENRRRGPRRKIVIVRSAVPSRDIGFLPGTEQEKLEAYERPYMDLVAFMLGDPQAYSRLKERRVIEFVSTSFLRGITLDECVILIDEAQDMTFQEVDTVLTRAGTNSKILVVGDRNQNDLGHKSGWDVLIRILKRIGDTNIIWFTTDDIVRSDWIRDYIIAKEEYNGETRSGKAQPGYAEVSTESTNCNIRGTRLGCSD